MYSEEDLNQAVEKGTFTQSAVDQFRHDSALAKNVASVDEEDFKLIGGFNDIFVVIACGLLLFSLLWVLRPVNESLALLVYAATAWALTEFFVRQRKMALPGIVLLLAFVWGLFTFLLSVLGEQSDTSLMIAAGITAVSTYAHWRRFAVPITVAAGTVAALGCLLAAVLVNFPAARDWTLALLFAGGFATFLYAMYWDSSDRDRLTHRSDVAFWLHLLSAPLIMHPLFSGLGILDGNDSLAVMVTVVAVYVLMTFISIAIDRRAFMVSSLIYVVYALSNIFSVYGKVGSGFALTGVLIGAALLLLSAFWHTARVGVVGVLPGKLQQKLPTLST